jgi:hypothetical protein
MHQSICNAFFRQILRSRSLSWVDAAYLSKSLAGASSRQGRQFKGNHCDHAAFLFHGRNDDLDRMWTIIERGRNPLGHLHREADKLGKDLSRVLGHQGRNFLQRLFFS